MLITLRNSGAETIFFNKNYNPETLLKIKNEMNPLLDPKNIDSFVLDIKNIKIEQLLLVEQTTYQQRSKNDPKKYYISIETDTSTYRLYYEEGVKPDFFKFLFKKIYPTMAENQIEELI